MNDLKKLIFDIEYFLDSNDLTDTPCSRGLAEQYRQKVCEFNKLAEQCQKMLECNMVIEAEQLASSGPRSLFQQQELLNFSRKEEFEELFKMYDWGDFPVIRNEILAALKKQTSEVSELLPLLEMYRKIARSNDDRTKIILLRKIVNIDTGKVEWSNSLKVLERKRIDTLTAEAKNAILAKDYDTLEILQEELLSPEWSVPVNALVTRKIAAVLQEKHEADLKLQAASYIDHINLAYSAQDFGDLSKAINNWQFFLIRTNYQPDNIQLAQFKEAEYYYLEQKSAYEQSQFVSNLLQQLESGITNQINYLELENIYSQLKSNAAEIPEELERNFWEYHTASEAVCRRKTFLITAAAASGIILFGVIAFLLTSSLILRHQEKKWCASITESLQTQPAADALTKIAFLKRNNPRVAKLEKILNLEKEALQKQQQELQKKEEFKKLAVQQNELFKNFVQNIDAINKNRNAMRLLIVDQQEETVYNQQDSLYQKEMLILQKQKEQKYLTIIEQIKNEYRKFYVALSNKDFEKAETIIEKAELLKSQAEAVEGLSQAIRISNKRTLFSILEMPQKLNAERKKFDQITKALNKIYDATSIAVLRNSINELIAQYPDNVEIEQIKKLKTALMDIQKFVKDEKNITNTVYADDYAKSKKILADNQKITEKLLQTFKQLHDLYVKNPMGCIIVYHNGEFYDFYYHKESSSGLLPTFPKHIIGNGKTRVLTLIKGHNDITIRREEKEIVSGKLSYPKPDDLGNYKDTAPHILFVNWYFKLLKTQKDTPWEKTVADGLRKCLSDDFIAPQMKVAICRMISKQVLNEIPDHPVYKEFSSQLEEIQKRVKTPTYNWLESYKEIHTHSQFRYELNELLKQEKFSTTQKKQFNYNILTFALNRKIIPAGYVVSQNGKYILKGNFSRRSSGELWRASLEPPYFTIIGSFQGDQIKLSDNAKIEPFQLLFTPEDGENTAELVKKFEAAAVNLELQTIEWPATWPATQE